MNRDDIIRMAREAMQSDSQMMGGTYFTLEVSDLERFAALVAAAERQACAQIAFNAKTYIKAADAIRARGEK